MDTVTVNGLVQAGFTLSDTSGCSPLTIELTNTTIGNVTYEWWINETADFSGPPDRTDDFETTSFVFENTTLTPKRYFVKLRVSRTNEDGSFFTENYGPDTLLVYPEFETTIVIDDQTINYLQKTVKFSQNTIPAITNLTYAWDFGNNNYSEDTDPPIQIFPKNDTISDYLVSLISTSEFFCKDTATPVNIIFGDTIVLGPGFNEESKISDLMGISDGSVAFADVDNDSDLDLLITGNNGANSIAKLYLNNGCGYFTELLGVPFSPVYNSSIAFADIDGDLDQDVLICGLANSGPVTELYINNGIGGFTLVSDTPFQDVFSGALAFADIDGDSDQDVLITGLNGGSKFSKLYKNDGSGNFTEVLGTPFDAVYLSSLAFVDIDSDMDLDVLIAGNNGTNLSTKLYKNNGSGVFTYTTSSPFEQVCSGSINFSDIDGDSDQDFLITGRVNYLGT
jgi:hypothetical protein